MYLPFFLILFTKLSDSARILCIFPTPFFSHQSVFQPIPIELIKRGHSVTLITTNPTKVNSSNFKEIDLSFSYDLVFNIHRMQDVINNEKNLLVLMYHALFVANNMTMEQLNHPEIQKLISADDQFDLMIVEAHVLAWFGFASKYNCPVIAITSLPPNNFLRRVIGNLNHPIYTHSVNLPFAENLNFWQRLVCVVFDIFEAFFHNYLLYPSEEKIIRSALNNSKIDIFKIAKNVSLLFTNEIPGFNKVATKIPSVVHLHGLQIQPPKVLPKEIEDFLNGAAEGAIYFSLGSSIKSSLFSDKTQKLLLTVFEQLQYKVIWKFEENINGIPNNVKVVTWAPQQDILRHKNVKLFITQGGLQSIDEAIKFKVPILGIPFFGDQFYNVKRVESLQIGSWLDIKTLTADKLKNVIVETVNNKTYLKNLDELSDLSSHPIKSLDKAIWWIEYVLRHNGAYHLRSPLADMPFYQYYLIDIFLFFVLVSSTTIFLISKLLKLKKSKRYKLE